jgi:hypothetical protein
LILTIWAWNEREATRAERILREGDKTGGGKLLLLCDISLLPQRGCRKSTRVRV